MKEKINICYWPPFIPKEIIVQPILRSLNTISLSNYS